MENSENYVVLPLLPDYVEPVTPKRHYKGHRDNIPVELGFCSTCQKFKPASCFTRGRKGRDKNYTCKECISIRAIKYRKRAKHHSWMKHYGISPEEYWELYDKQNGVCAICGNPETRTHKGVEAHLCVDHDHVTGKVRGLLCGPCNTGLGQFRDNSAYLASAIDYLAKSQNHDEK